MAVDPRCGGQALARRQLLTDEERQALFGFPIDLDGLTRCFTLSRSDRELAAERRNGTSRLGYAVQLALLRHPGTTLTYLGRPVEPLVAWMAEQLDIPASAFARVRAAHPDRDGPCAAARCGAGGASGHRGRLAANGGGRGGGSPRD